MAEKIQTTFRTFINDITITFPEYSERLLESYQCCFEDNELNEKLRQFLNNVYKNIDMISERDESLFSNDPILLDNVSFKMMWNSNISMKTKNTIWKYLQSFCIFKIRLLTSNSDIERVKKLIENKNKLKKPDKLVVKHMKLIKKLNSSILDNEMRTPPEENSSMEGMENLLKNTSIGKIAEEITQELNLDEMLGNIDESQGIEQIFNGDTMSKLFTTINSKMASRQGQFNPNELMKEATSICSSMQGNPLFNSLMGMQGDMLSQMQSNTPTNPTRERLKKKISEKKESEGPDVD